MRLLITIIVALTGTIAGADPSLITIRGLNLESSAQEIEAIMGSCQPHPAADDPVSIFQCGEHPHAGYELDDRGRLKTINFHCSFIEGCAYDGNDLITMLSDSLSLDNVRLGELTHTADNAAGDRLVVITLPEMPYIVISEYNYRKPALKLD